MKNFFLKLFIKYFLPKHKFKVGDLIYKEGTRVLYEVDTNHYDTNLHPVTIVRNYPTGSQLIGIDRHSIIEYREYRKALSLNPNTTPSDVGITAHENTIFGKLK